jgi:hypothetical protein
MRGCQPKKFFALSGFRVDAVQDGSAPMAARIRRQTSRIAPTAPALSECGKQVANGMDTFGPLLGNQ